MHTGTIQKTFIGPFCHLRARRTVEYMPYDFSVVHIGPFAVKQPGTWFRCPVELNYTSRRIKGTKILAKIKREFLPIGWKLHPHSN